MEEDHGAEEVDNTVENKKEEWNAKTIEHVIWLASVKLYQTPFREARDVHGAGDDEWEVFFKRNRPEWAQPDWDATKDAERIIAFLESEEFLGMSFDNLVEEWAAYAATITSGAHVDSGDGKGGGDSSSRWADVQSCSIEDDDDQFIETV